MRQQRSMRSSQQLKSSAPFAANLITLAERELAAFDKAVCELFGPEQARLSTAEWIDELESMDWPARLGVSDFRRITTAASTKLAHRKLSRIIMRSESFRGDVSPYRKQHSDITVKQM
jgi:hypothetical protein